MESYHWDHLKRNGGPEGLLRPEGPQWGAQRAPELPSAGASSIKFKQIQFNPNKFNYIKINSILHQFNSPQIQFPSIQFNLNKFN